MNLLELIAVGASLLIIVAVVLLIRRGKLMEKYAILWLACSAALLVFSLWRDLLDIVAHSLGFYYPPAFLFLAGMVFLLLILLHVSVVISKLTQSRGALVRELALLRLEVERLRDEIGKALKRP